MGRTRPDEGEEADRWVRHVSEVRSCGGYPFGSKRYWAGAALAAGPIWFPSALFIFFVLFFLFFFCFLISFITFAFWLQFDSNQLLKFSKTQNIIATQ
jgi:hypothetical protein